MPTNTTQNNALSLTLDGTEINCQVIDLTVTMPGDGTGETAEVACPDGTVTEPGQFEDGAIGGSVYADTPDSGVTWLLMQAKAAGATMDYVLTWFADQDGTVAFTWTGQAQVGTFSMDWTKPGLARHPIDLALIDKPTIARPA